QWMYSSSGDVAPTYYTHSDAPLYYYSFTDAHIAMAYRSLTPEQQSRFDPMITGFNPTDMYAADHIRRVLTTFPGVFSGVGEFTIHKEFVSSKVAGEVATVDNKALERILDFAGEVGLPVVLHCDVDMPFPSADQDPYLVEKLKELFKRHPNTTIIWAHIGLGRVVRPPAQQLQMVERILTSPELSHVYFDISWQETAKYLMENSDELALSAEVINAHPERILFGTDVVAPRSQEQYLAAYYVYAPLLHKLTPRAKRLLLRGNYERIFDNARERVRAWEAEHVLSPTSPAEPAAEVSRREPEVAHPR
ncbi:MAG: amidohydrolase family protein, partial [Planctomycetota bacterium]